MCVRAGLVDDGIERWRFCGTTLINCVHNRLLGGRGTKIRLTCNLAGRVTHLVLLYSVYVRTYRGARKKSRVLESDERERAGYNTRPGRWAVFKGGCRARLSSPPKKYPPTHPACRRFLNKHPPISSTLHPSLAPICSHAKTRGCGG